MLSKLIKIVIGLLLVVAAIASMGMVWVEDSSERPEYCAFCHDDRAYKSWASAESEFLARDHAEMAISCQRCHPRTINDTMHEILVYSQEGYKPSSIQKRTSDTLCLTCHGNTAEIAKRTQNYLIDGEVHNPHDPHASIEGPSTAPYTLECFRCHTMHKESPGATYCYSCHHTYDLISCNSSGCHDESEGY
jgi:Zn finger protein HypA/HybF involved in hydrogenase expression